MEKCEYCDIVSEDVEWTEDPFDEEIHGDDTKHWLCPDCVYQAGQDI